jgi:hypothetical protein
MAWPDVIAPFAHGVPAGKGGSGILDGMRQHQFMRACFGIAVCTCIGVIITLFTRPESAEKQRGLVWGTISDGLRYYKGSAGTERPANIAHARPINSGAKPEYVGAGKLPVATISRNLAGRLQARVGDLLYVSDARRWTGGLNSAQMIVAATTDADDEQIVLDDLTFKQVVANRRADKPVSVECLY